MSCVLGGAMAAPMALLVFAAMLGVALAMAFGYERSWRRRRARLREREERTRALFERLKARAEGQPPTPGEVLAEWRRLQERSDEEP